MTLASSSATSGSGGGSAGTMEICPTLASTDTTRSMALKTASSAKRDHPESVQTSSSKFADCRGTEEVKTDQVKPDQPLGVHFREHCGNSCEHSSADSVNDSTQRCLAFVGVCVGIFVYTFVSIFVSAFVEEFVGQALLSPAPFLPKLILIHDPTLAPFVEDKSGTPFLYWPPFALTDSLPCLGGNTRHIGSSNKAGFSFMPMPVCPSKQFLMYFGTVSGPCSSLKFTGFGRYLENLEISGKFTGTQWNSVGFAWCLLVIQWEFLGWFGGNAGFSCESLLSLLKPSDTGARKERRFHSAKP